MIQKRPTARKSVPQDRADEMVLAGSAPANASYSGDPIAHVHRGTSFIVLVDTAIVIYLSYTALSAIGVLGSPSARSAYLAITLVVGLSLYSGYKNRKPWAYWPAVAALFTASLMFAFLAFLNLLQALLSGMLMGLLFTFLMGWAALGSGRRAVFHWHPVYRNGYQNASPLSSFRLQDGEMLAACPTCLAVLAIQPAMLGQADRCPHCGNGLVSEHLLAKHALEEA